MVSNYLVDGFDEDTLRNIGQRKQLVRVSFKDMKPSDLNVEKPVLPANAPVNMVEGFDTNTLKNIGERNQPGQVQFFETTRQLPMTPQAAQIEGAFRALKNIPNLVQHLFKGQKYD